MKDVQAIGEVFSSQREHPALFENTDIFLFLWVNSALLDPDPADQNQCGLMRLRIHITGQIP
jgi:hypothetical protein